MWGLFCHYLISISPSFGASGRACFLLWHCLGTFTYIFVGVFSPPNMAIHYEYMPI